MSARFNIPSISGDDPIQTYQLQSGLMRQRQPGSRARMAQQLMQQGSSTAPVQHWMQGLARAVQGTLGGYMAGDAERQEAATEQEMLARMIGDRDQRRQGETAQLAQAGVPGFEMPMPQPVPGEAQQVPVAPAGGGDVVMPPNMPQAPAQPPPRPVNAEMIAALSGMAGQGNRTAAGALPGMQFQYQDSERKAGEARMAAAAAAQNQPRPQAPAEFQRKRDEMIANGVPPQIASGLATGQIRLVTNDLDGSVRIIDMGTGQEMRNPDNPPPPPPPPPPGSATPPPPAAGSTGQTIPGEGVDYPSATGLPGAAGRLANTIADMFGGSLPGPEQERATQALTNLATRTQMHLQTAIPGRPSNYLMEMIGELTLKPNQITVGPQRAAERVAQTRKFVEQTVREMEEVAGASGQRRFSREQISQANLALQSLRPLLADYQALDAAFAGRGAQPGGNIPTISSPGDAASLPAGSQFRTPDGRVMRVPAR